jgi:putative transposase
MALSQSDLQRLLESLRTADGIELVRNVAERMLQELIEAELSDRISAQWNEHTEARTAFRNGHREKTLATQAGDLDLAYRSCAAAASSPACWNGGAASTRRSTPSSWRHTCTGCPPPYLYLDATYCKVRVNHRIVSQAVVIATGISEDGGREVLGVMVGDSETEAFWSEFLRSLRERGLGGVRLVISDSHSGLVKAIRKVMLGAAWQRCRVHFLRNVFSVIPKGSGEMVAATIRTIFIQPTAEAVHHQLDAVADMLGQQFGGVIASKQQCR